MDRLKSPTGLSSKASKLDWIKQRKTSGVATPRHVVLPYHPRTYIGETPYILVYESEVVIPAKVGITSTRVEAHDSQLNEKKLRINLDLLEERRK